MSNVKFNYFLKNNPNNKKTNIVNHMWHRILYVLLFGWIYLHCAGQEVRLGLPLGHIHTVVSAKFNADESRSISYRKRRI